MSSRHGLDGKARRCAGWLLAILVVLSTAPASGEEGRVAAAESLVPPETSALTWEHSRFPARWRFAGNTAWDEAVVGDFNGDGRTDFARPLDDAVYLFLSREDGTFQMSLFRYPAGMRLGLNRADRRLVAADFDGDGRADLASLEARRVRILFSRIPRDLSERGFAGRLDLPAGAFARAEHTFPKEWGFAGPVWGWHRGVVADFNGDGKADLARPGILHTHVFLGRGDGRFVELLYRFPKIPGLGGDWWGGWWVLAGDVDGDGRDDLVLGDAKGLHVLHGQLPRDPSAVRRNSQRWIPADSFRMSSVALPPGAVPERPPLLGDFDGDGRADLAWVQAGATVLLRGPGLGPGPGSATSSGESVVGDFDGDGRADVATLSPSGARLLLGASSGSFRMLPIRPDRRREGYPRVIAGDFDGDRRADLALLYPTGVSVLRMRDLRVSRAARGLGEAGAVGRPSPSPGVGGLRARQPGSSSLPPAPARERPISQPGGVGARPPSLPSLQPAPDRVRPLGELGVQRRSEEPVAPAVASKPGFGFLGRRPAVGDVPARPEPRADAGTMRRNCLPNAPWHCRPPVISRFDVLPAKLVRPGERVSFVLRLVHVSHAFLDALHPRTGRVLKTVSELRGRPGETLRATVHDVPDSETLYRLRISNGDSARPVMQEILVQHRGAALGRAPASPPLAVVGSMPPAASKTTIVSAGVLRLVGVSSVGPMSGQQMQQVHIQRMSLVGRGR